MSNPKPINEQLVDLFNAALAQQNIETVYAVADLTFGAPTPYDPETIDASEPESANTWIDATTGEGFEQINYRLHYCRLDLAFLSAKKDDFFEAAFTAATTAHELLTELSAAFGTEVTAEDIEDTTVSDVTAEQATLVVKALSTSLAFRGETSVIVLAPPAG